MRKNIVILISGRGSNMQAIVNADIPNANIAAVISNRPQSEGLVWAKQKGINTLVVDHETFPDRESFDAALIDEIDHYNPNLVVLAGFMRILTPDFCEHYNERLMNIHPSLLPAFPGINVHERVLSEGCKISGCTVHFVTPKLDGGPIISQAAVPVFPYDTPEDLAMRVLICEHQIYPQAVSDFVSGSLKIKNRTVFNSKRRNSVTDHLLT